MNSPARKQPRILLSGTDGVSMLVGFHDGCFRGVRCTIEQSVLLWFAAPDGTEYQLRLRDIGAIFVNSFTGSNIVNAVTLYEARVSPLALFARLHALESAAYESVLHDRHSLFKQTQGSLFELATSDGCSVLAEIKQGPPLVDIVETTVRRYGRNSRKEKRKGVKP